MPADVERLFLKAAAAPDKIHSYFLRGRIHKVPNAVLLPRRDNEIFRKLLLQHHPHHLNAVPGVAPVTFHVHIAEIQTAFQAHLDPRETSSDLAGHEGLTPE